MGTTLTAVFDGETLRPDGPVDLQPNRRYVVRVELADSTEAPPETAWDVLDALEGAVSAPGDWATDHDHYLYGSQRRHGTGGSPEAE